MAVERLTAPLAALRDPQCRPALIVSGALLAWGCIPLAVLLLDVARRGGVLSGSEGMLAGPDQLFYMSSIRESGRDGLISNQYRLGYSEGVFFHPMFALSGLLWKAGLSVKLALLVWKPIAAAALGVGAWAYVSRLLNGHARLAAAGLALFFFSPALPVLDWGGVSLDGLDRFTMLLVSGESMPALQLWGYLHAALVIGLMPLVLLGTERVLDPARRRPGRGQGWYLGWTTAGGLAIAWLHPWQGATLIAVLLGVAAWGRFAPRYRALAIPVVAMCVPMLYEVLLTKLDIDWRISAAQNAGALAPTWILLAGLAPLVIPAIAGVRLRTHNEQERMLVLWAVAALAVYFLATTFPFHALQGITFPLAVLAVRGFQRLRMPSVAGVACVLALTLPGAAFALGTFRDSKNSGEAPYRLDSGENEALHFLARAPEPGGVLARFYLGMTVPALTGRDTWVGQYSWTPSFNRRRPVAEDLFAGRLPPRAARRLVRSIRPAFLLADCGARADLSQLLGPLVTKTHRFGCAAVYVVTP